MLDIRIDILNVIVDGESKPTRIMYSTNMSWKPLRKSLKSLTDQGLIKVSGSDDRDKRGKENFEITEKGRRVLKFLHEARQMVGSPELSDRHRLPG